MCELPVSTLHSKLLFPIALSSLINYQSILLKACEKNTISNSSSSFCAVGLQLLPIYLHMLTMNMFPFYLVHSLSLIFTMLISWSDLSPRAVRKLLLNPSGIRGHLCWDVCSQLSYSVLLSICTAVMIKTLCLSVLLLFCHRVEYL